MKVDAVFSGGGVKAFAFVGALESIEENGIQLERVAGTSAGAIVASLIAAGYKTKDIHTLITQLNIESFLDPPKLTKIIPGTKWLFLYFQMGLNRGDKLEYWLYEQLAKQEIYNFGDVPQGYLKLVVSDLSLGRLVVIPDDLQTLYGIDPNLFPIAKAVRMSAGFPYFFMPKKLHGNDMGKSFIVDGGLLSNFPLWIFENKPQTRTIPKRPILGVKLSESTQMVKPNKIKNALDMFLALFSTMKQAHDARYVSSAEKNNIIFIPVHHVGTTNFYISDEEKQALIKLGKERANQFLRTWEK